MAAGSSPANRHSPAPDVPLIDGMPELVQRRPRLLIPVGRGRQGKSLFIRWVVERARKADRQVVLGDADRTNRTLSEFFEDASSPSVDESARVVRWYQDFTSQQIEHRHDACIDVGGGDTTMKILARDGFATLMAQEDIDLVIAYFVGAAEDDLRHVEQLENSWRGVRPASFVVFNTNALPTDMGEDEIVEKILMPNTALKALLERGSEIVRMPKLQAAAEIERERLLFWEAIDRTARSSRPKLSVWSRHHVEIWLEEMENAMAPIVAWLP